MTDVKEFYALGFVDDIAEKIGFPKTRPLLKALSPQNVLGGKLGLTSPGEVLETIVEDIDAKASGSGLPTPPGLPKFPGM